MPGWYRDEHNTLLSPEQQIERLRARVKELEEQNEQLHLELDQGELKATDLTMAENAKLQEALARRNTALWLTWRTIACTRNDKQPEWNERMDSAAPTQPPSDREEEVGDDA